MQLRRRWYRWAESNTQTIVHQAREICSKNVHLQAGGGEEGVEGGAVMDGTAGVEPENACGDTESENEEEPTCEGSIGALLSASFCERINSCANQIVTTGNTSLGDDLVDKMVVLRINRNFMKFMQLKYPTILKQKFPTFGTVITVTDNQEDDVEIDSD